MLERVITDLHALCEFLVGGLILEKELPLPVRNILIMFGEMSSGSFRDSLLQLNYEEILNLHDNIAILLFKIKQSKNSVSIFDNQLA